MFATVWCLATLMAAGVTAAWALVLLRHKLKVSKVALHESERLYRLSAEDMTDVPGMGGSDATPAIRSIPGHADLPIVAMTTSVLPEQERELRSAGRAAMEADALFDPVAFDSIAALLGGQKTSETLVKFLNELQGRLKRDDLEPSGRDTFQRDAHVVTSIAGMLGFNDLAQSCAAVVMASLDEGQAFELKAIEVLRARHRATAQLHILIAKASETASHVENAA